MRGFAILDLRFAIGNEPARIVASPRQSAVLFTSIIGGALTRRRFIDQERTAIVFQSQIANRKSKIP